MSACGFVPLSQVFRWLREIRSNSGASFQARSNESPVVWSKGQFRCQVQRVPTVTLPRPLPLPFVPFHEMKTSFPDGRKMFSIEVKESFHCQDHETFVRAGSHGFFEETFHGTILASHFTKDRSGKGPRFLRSHTVSYESRHEVPAPPCRRSNRRLLGVAGLTGPAIPVKGSLP